MFALMVSAIRLAERDDSVACDIIFQIGNLWVVMALTENFTVRAPNCRSDNKNHKSSRKQ